MDNDDNDYNSGGGHIIRTLVFGLIANAFDVGSDLLNAFQYYRCGIIWSGSILAWFGLFLI